MTRIIGVVSGKGGVGKTTIVMNLGAELASKFKKDVLLVDCNITTSHLSMSLGMHFVPVTLNQVLKGDAHIESAIYTHPTGMKIIPASLGVKDAEGIDTANVKKHIKQLLGKVDIILLDAAPGLGKESQLTLSLSDEILFVTTPYVPAVMDIIRTKEMIKGEKTRLGVVLNMVTNERHELSKKEIEQLTEMPVIASIPYDKNVLKSLAAKQPVTTFNPNAKASREFTQLAAEITGEAPVKTDEGFFEAIFSKIKAIPIPRLR
ncbi:MAG: cell division ATPase MinD [Candidatus Aenigmatarchaeota archaeon]